MLGRSYINPDARFIIVFKIEPTARNGLVRAIDRDAPRTSAYPQFFPRLVFFSIKITHPRRHLPHVTHFNRFYMTHTREQVGAEFLQGVAVGGGQAKACDYNAVEFHY